MSNTNNKASHALRRHLEFLSSRAWLIQKVGGPGPELLNHVRAEFAGMKKALRVVLRYQRLIKLLQNDYPHINNVWVELCKHEDELPEWPLKEGS